MKQDPPILAAFIDARQNIPASNRRSPTATPPTTLSLRKRNWSSQVSSQTQPKAQTPPSTKPSATPKRATARAA
ncbi:MAG TPA: hypothetical protein VGC66_24545 [Pyrinomonadaceae bacterium]